MMNGDLQKSLQQAICSLYGESVKVIRRIPVSGGDINRAYVLELSNGERIFMKANRFQNPGFFKAEAEGLKAIRKTGTISAPKVLALGTDTDSSFLLLEYIRSGQGGSAASAELGRKLAQMHLAGVEGFVQDGRFGFHQDNYIGTSIQTNTAKNSWIEFFAECRLKPQFRMAETSFDTKDRRKMEYLIAHLDRYLEEPEQPSLLHGDLWAGNYMIDSAGTPWLIDPAVYVGHREADLAMTELFGGFDHAFYDAYKNEAGIDPGYPKRRDLYNLYHLLNHLNLFGSSYLRPVRAILDRYQ